VELHQQWSCFQKHKPELFVVCYEEGNSPIEKRTMNIPIRYRSKFLQKRQQLVPEQVGSIPWQPMEVKFTLL
jgi:hypothetical protein